MMRLSSICASRWLDGGRIPLNSPIVLRTLKGKSTYIARCKYTPVDSQHDRGVKVFQTALKQVDGARLYCKRSIKEGFAGEARWPLASYPGLPASCASILRAESASVRSYYYSPTVGHLGCISRSTGRGREYQLI
jgi:hypothetical protein